MGRRPDSSLLTTVCWPFNGLLGAETQFRPIALWGCYFYFIGCEEVAQETGSKFVSSNSPIAGVTVIWGFPRFGHPHSQILMIYSSPVVLTLTLTQITKVI